MNKKSLSEADIRSKFITPALCGPEGAGWDLMTQITIVRLPNGVFNPYTGIRTNLLFFTKGAPTREVWYYEHPYPPGAKSYNKGKPIRIEEFEAERAWWGDEKDGFKSRVENERAWRVSIDQIKAGNFNLDLKNPHSTDTGPGDVDQLLADYEKLLAQIAGTRGQLKAQLMEALTR
jgi:type I restriction enzyme M protein